MREELAAANEEQELERQIAKLRAKRESFRERGAIKTPDPQGGVVSRHHGRMALAARRRPGTALLLGDDY